MSVVSRDREAEAASMPDAVLVRRVFEVVGKLAPHDDALTDDLYFLLEESFERFAPDAAWEDRVRYHRAKHGDDAAREIGGLREAFDRRRRLREARDGEAS